MSTKEGTFVVAEADEGAVVLRDADDGQVHPLSSNPGLDAGTVVDATLTAEPPMEVTWSAEVHETREVELVRTDLEPTRQAREAAADQSVGDLARLERAGEGEVHVLSVPAEEVETAATDVLEDEATLERAARIGAVRVEVRTGEGLLSVRYLPD